MAGSEIKFYCSEVFKLPEFEQAISALLRGRAPVEVSGLSPVHKANLIAAAVRKTGRRAAVICPDEASAKKIIGDVRGFGIDPAVLMPERDMVLTGNLTYLHEWEQKRIAAAAAFAQGQAEVMAGSAGAFMQRFMPRRIFEKVRINLKTDDVITIAELTQRLLRAGYTQSAAIEGVGQFSVRGGIIDIFSPNYRSPIRIEFFDDVIDTIWFFDVQSQRRQDAVSRISVLPAGEIAFESAEAVAAAHKKICAAAEKAADKGLTELTQLLNSDAEAFLQSGGTVCPDRLIPFVYAERACAADYFDDALVFIDDPARTAENAASFEGRMNLDVRTLIEEQRLCAEHSDFFREYGKFCSALDAKNVFLLSIFGSKGGVIKPKTQLQFNVKQLPSYNGSFDSLKSDIEYYFSNKFRVVVLCAGEQRCKNLLETLRQSGVEAAYSEQPSDFLPSGTVLITSGGLSAGFEYPELKIALISEEQFAGAAKSVKKRRHKDFDTRERVKNYADLRPGDVIVHQTHGIGRFIGIERLCVDGAEKDYIRIAFAGTDTLFLPVSSLDVICKYIGGGEDAQVKLSRLGGTDWQSRKKKARAAAQDMAKKLVALYAERQRRPGYAFPADDAHQAAFEEAFEYDETDDQIRSISEIKADMQSTVPMDRLLCGDVGVGKTEVAFRAVMKCVLSGKQAAMLVPTTVLARQHYLTALSRFKGTGVNIDVISRYKTGSAERKTLNGIKNGRTDFIIGTHKLLAKKLEFYDLGLLVVDEEQRFGVSHKETIKQMAKNVDVLTLSATPIPRTLGMALSGIRDMSLIEEPPVDRQPVTTYVAEYDAGMIIDAIKRELARGGQVYYVHNRTESVSAVARRLSEKLPEANVAYAHGKMSEEQISSVMQSLSDGEIQILVCTTIIETGIDVPNVNTLIIENAENFGLSQLHQLRGRVGRSSRRAYAYFTYRPGKALTEISQKRLAAIREFAEFGAGFKIAMRDLEIRGAGNVLGAEQSGHMASVGYDMYLRLLEDAVLEEQGQQPAKRRSDCVVELPLSANIPEKYIADSGQRIDFYKRISQIRDVEDYSDIIDELIDRYGEIPRPAMTLLDISLLRADAANAGISEISQKERTIIVKFFNFDFARLSQMCARPEYRGRLLLSAGKEPYLSIRLKKEQDPLEQARSFVKEFCAEQKHGEHGKTAAAKK